MEEVVVITGGATGIGFECAKELGKKNYSVLIAGRRIDELEQAKNELEKLKVKAYYMVADVTKIEDVKALVKKAKQIGEIAVVVNCAGVAPQNKNNENVVINVNAIGTYLIGENFYKEMKSGGCIVNISSITAYLIPKLLTPKGKYKLLMKDMEKGRKKLIRLSRLFGKKFAPNLAYAISKNFVVFYTKSVSKRFYDENKIRIISLSPSNFKTPMGNFDMAKHPDDVKKYFKKQAIQQSGEPCQIGYLVAVLSDERAGILTAEDIHIDGGWYGYNNGKIRW
jgi:NAD(P)-dependent dehydrogenase (short-subunit alcohol dehydrogenase family)